MSHYAYLLAATAYIAHHSDRVAQRRTARLLTAGGVLLDHLLAPSNSAPWWAAVYYLKLLTGHAGGAAALPRDPLGHP